uniref:Uncharacterized protein n=1 Tax=Rhizophora mucronata TaxID=61149 RepID=A0A2P2NYA8_RHIMU
MYSEDRWFPSCFKHYWGQLFTKTMETSIFSHQCRWRLLFNVLCLHRSCRKFILSQE